MHLAPELLEALGACVGTGQRIGDVLAMRWSNIEDGAVWVRQSKTSKELWVPILPELQAALDAASRHSVFILTNGVV